MKQPDDYRQSELPFYDRETEGHFLDQETNNLKRQVVDRSFETQSGYLVLIKQVGSRYALSFKRQIGTPPTSSVFLTADEGKRLANLISSNPAQHNESADNIAIGQLEQDLLAMRAHRTHKPAIIMSTVLFVISLLLWVALAMIVYQSQCRAGY